MTENVLLQTHDPTLNNAMPKFKADMWRQQQHTVLMQMGEESNTLWLMTKPFLLVWI